MPEVTGVKSRLYILRGLNARIVETVDGLHEWLARHLNRRILILPVTSHWRAEHDISIENQLWAKSQGDSMFSWLFGSKRTSKKEMLVATIDNGGGVFAIDVVGESHYQKELSTICGGKTEDGHEHQCSAHLILEKDNPHDNQAVRVDISGNTVGYLSRKNARKFRKELAAAAPGADVSIAQCPAMIVGGWSRDRGKDQGHFGVKLDLPEA